MKKLMLCLSILLSLLGVNVGGNYVSDAFAAEISPSGLVSDCKSAYLCDYNSGECVFKMNETERLPIASVCKVMTLNLCFDAIESGKIALDDKVTVSDKAAGMGGSQVFLQSGLSYPVEQLIKSIIVCSANDSCVAMSEAVCGSEEQFVAKMNEKASEYGCNDTLFANCTGLPKDTQYSCARDVAVMFSHLIEREEYFNYSKIWLEDFAHPDGRTTSITNTNKLIRRYSACDGGKTGFTNQAGFCLVASAIKNNLRLISVVLGADSSDIRFANVSGMFDYGFANYENTLILDQNVNLNEVVAVNGGKKETIAVKPSRSSFIFSGKGQKLSDVVCRFIPYSVSAPVAKCDVVGRVEVYKDGLLYDTIEVISAEECLKASYGDNIKKVTGGWAV